jgi:hypothetical protein
VWLGRYQYRYYFGSVHVERPSGDIYFGLGDQHHSGDSWLIDYDDGSTAAASP